ncbi:LysR family transcriptional regulator [Vibrio sinaloensis]|uniref:LysR family transcriptional regulator n=1 Tax=Photobacterium sp. (strain ATCC 43367) TaxID=379097 RepID=UPI0020667ED1|nr:LysR family transcriptional regulator [Vibrio sinaloensis]UPQ88979.1 LysR family transcriptional regulator [Vibrio sinaloensis]
MTKDLNLLRLLLVLSEEQQTITAAKRLHVSQPSISVMLKKLREQFNDPLFIRNKNKLEPTSRCLDILGTLPALLDQMDALYVDDSTWDITTLSGEYTFIFSPQLMTTLGVPVIEKLTSLAPNVTVDCYQWGFDALRDIELRTNCWGFSYLPMESNKNIMQRDIGVDEFMVIVRPDHPIQGESLKDLLRYPLCINLIHGETESSRSEKMIKKLGLMKHINVRTSDLSMMMSLVETTDYVGIVSKYNMERLKGRFRFISLPPELTDEARYREVAQFTHQRNRANPLTKWLFDQCKDIFDDY